MTSFANSRTLQNPVGVVAKLAEVFITHNVIGYKSASGEYANAVQFIYETSMVNGDSSSSSTYRPFRPRSLSLL